MSIDPRYPIGLFVPQASYSSLERHANMAVLANAHSHLRTAVAGLSESQLNTTYRDGGWTVRQVVHHIPDSHTNMYIRVKLALTESEPIIKPYDEQAWALLADNTTVPPEVSISMLGYLQSCQKTIGHACTSIPRTARSVLNAPSRCTLGTLRITSRRSRNCVNAWVGNGSRKAIMSRSDLPVALTAEFKDCLKRSVLCWLATIGEDGSANLSPKEIFVTTDDDRILIANIASPISVRNIKHNPNVCLSFVDVFVQRGFKVNALAKVIEKSDPRFEQELGPLKQIAGQKFPIHGIIELEVQRIAPILAPRYRLYPDTTEAAQVGRAVKTYNRVLERHGVKLVEDSRD
jgi:uncharacterized protein